MNTIVSDQNKNVLRYEECTLTPMDPILEDPFKNQDQTLLFSTYFGESMLPTLISGDRVLLKKIDKITNWGEVHLLQINNDDYDIFCRPRLGETPESIYISYDNPEGKGGVEGQDVPKEYITGIWELVLSQRVHSQSFFKAQIPIFK